MAQERLTMRKIREVLRLKWEHSLSNRAIARSCSISHSTVGEYVRRAKEAGLSWPLPKDLDEDRLFEILFPRPPDPGSRVIPCPDWSWVHAELRKKSVTLRLLWVEYREDHPSGYGYSQFCALYREWAKRLKPSMRLSHKGGEKVFVDYAGQTVPIVDPDTGETHTAQIFIGVLGASNYTYAEAHWRQDLPTGLVPTCGCSPSWVACPKSLSLTISKLGSSIPAAMSPISIPPTMTWPNTTAPL